MNISIIKECNNKLTIVNIDGLKYVFSYESLIGVIYNNTLFLNDYYNNYSVTTNKHINECFNYYASYLIRVQGALFKELKDNKFDPIQLEKILYINNKNNKIYNYLESVQEKINNKQIDLNKKTIYLLEKNLNLLFNVELELLKTEKESLKNVNKYVNYYKVNNITFKIVFTYKKNVLNNLKLYKLEKDIIKGDLI